ncbi:MAG: hypothetical protein Sapg2KO_36690 [Saprospiraceae bacterium]
MSQIEIDEVADRAVRISELIEEVILLDNLLSLHKEKEANLLESQQYLDRKEEFLNELNNLLYPHHIRVVYEDQAA